MQKEEDKHGERNRVEKEAATVVEKEQILVLPPETRRRQRHRISHPFLRVVVGGGQAEAQSVGEEGGRRPFGVGPVPGQFADVFEVPVVRCAVVDEIGQVVEHAEEGPHFEEEADVRDRHDRRHRFVDDRVCDALICQ